MGLKFSFQMGGGKASLYHYGIQRCIQADAARFKGGTTSANSAIRFNCSSAGASDASALEWRIIMSSLALKLRRFLVSEDGPTAVEYAVMLSLIVVVCLAAINTIGQNANNVFGKAGSSIK
jgi:pilus assembly protein Flp/PilA